MGIVRNLALHFAFFGVSLFVFQWSVQAQQQTPTSTIQKTKRTGIIQGSNTTIEWEALDEATRYLIVISNDPEMKKVYLTGKSETTRYITPELPSGTYYYHIEGFSESESLGKTPIKKFIVGKPMVLKRARGDGLPAPAIVAPEHMRFYPDRYGVIRLAWEKVKGARKYRIRIFKDEDKEYNVLSRQNPPRWSTQIKLPFIEIRDVPYGSFMYLEPGIYRWDVAAVDKKGNVGKISEEYFAISSQWFLESELVLRGIIGFNPKVTVNTTDAKTNVSSSKSSASYEYEGEVEWWPSRTTGIAIDFGARSVRLGDSDGSLPRTDYSHIGAYLMSRNYLSDHAAGWTIWGGLGVSYREFPEVISLSQVATGAFQMGKNSVLGPGIVFGISKRYDSPFEIQLLGSAMYHFTGASLDPSFNGDIGLRIYMHWSDRVATGIDAMGELGRQVSLGIPVFSHLIVQLRI